MSVDDDIDRKKNRYHFDRHTPEYRTQFAKITEEIHAKCPVAWSDTYEGHWVAGGSQAVFELARCPVVSNDHDINGERQGYKGISIPTAKRASGVRGGILEMDEPEHRIYRTVLNPFLSPAAVKRWVPFVNEVTRACLDEKIEGGRIDFVDDLANVVPAVLTLAMLGISLKKWSMYSEPTHAALYTPEHSPDLERVNAMHRQMGLDLLNNMIEIKENPRPGIVNALIQLQIDGEPAPDLEIMGNLGLVIGGGFDTTTALTAHSLEWLSEHPDERERLSQHRDTLLDPATEEFLRYFTPAAGDGRTFSDDVEIEALGRKQAFGSSPDQILVGGFGEIGGRRFPVDAGEQQRRDQGRGASPERVVLNGAAGQISQPVAQGGACGLFQPSSPSQNSSAEVLGAPTSLHPVSPAG